MRLDFNYKIISIINNHNREPDIQKKNKKESKN